MNGHVYEIVNIAALTRWVSPGAAMSGGRESVRTNTSAVENPRRPAAPISPYGGRVSIPTVLRRVRQPAIDSGQERAIKRLGIAATANEAGSWIRFSAVRAAVMYAA